VKGNIIINLKILFLDDIIIRFDFSRKRFTQKSFPPKQTNKYREKERGGYQWFD